MGLIERMFSMLFGGGNVIKETAEVFRENAEAGAEREHALSQAALAQFAAEFAVPRRGLFDRFMDAVNRLPRPALAMGTLGLFVAAMVSPIWFAERMQGIALVPEPLWWLLGAIVSFYFGARHQTKSQEFQRGLAETLSRAGQVTRNIKALRDLGDAIPSEDQLAVLTTSEPTATAAGPDGNAALEDWRRSHGQ